MSTSPAERPDPGLVTFTARGNDALDRLAADLVDQCDGSTASIAEILERILEADIEDLAESLSQTTWHADRPGHDVEEVGPAAKSPDEAARRRLGSHTPGVHGTPGTRGIEVGR